MRTSHSPFIKYIYTYTCIGMCVYVYSIINVGLLFIFQTLETLNFWLICIRFVFFLHYDMIWYDIWYTCHLYRKTWRFFLMYMYARILGVGNDFCTSHLKQYKSLAKGALLGNVMLFRCILSRYSEGKYIPFICASSYANPELSWLFPIEIWQASRWNG